MKKTRHLDLGSGLNPRNPFFADELYGIDIIEIIDLNLNFIYNQCNLCSEKLPFEDNYFDSISGYDIFEHILRIQIESGITRFPFVEIMSEIYRVLKPNGQLYAITPVYPKESAFVDPTHVNFISNNTYKYFTTPHNWAKIYGFKGNFEKIRVSIVNFEIETKHFTLSKKNILTLINMFFSRRKQHIVWHFSAKKSFQS